MKRLIIIGILVLNLIFAFGCSKNEKNYISQKEAMDIALKDASVTKEDAVFVKTEADRDDGRKVYEIEFFTNDNVEYDYEIDAKTGKIISYDADAEGYVSGNEAPEVSSGKAETTQEEIEISEEDAVKIALEEVPGATQKDVRVKRDFDDGRKQYDVTVIYDKIEYDFEIDAKTGTILEKDSESVFDD